MGRVCVGRLCYGLGLQWAEFAMGRDVQLPSQGTKPYQAHNLSVCCVLRAHAQLGDVLTLSSPTATLIPFFPAQSTLGGCGYPGLLDRKKKKKKTFGHVPPV